MTQQQNPYAALQAWPQFILWRNEPRPGKKSAKVPCTADGSARIDPHESAHWMDYATAARAATERGLGIGFVLTSADPFFLLDIDGARHSDSWSLLATQLCAMFHGALVEVSVSGDGLHVIGSYSRIAEHSKRRDDLGLELYSAERFIALGHPDTAKGDSGFICDAPLAGLIPSFFTPRPEATNDDWTTEPVDGWRGPTNDDELIVLARRTTPIGAAFGAQQTKATFADLFDCNVDVLAEFYPSESHDDFNRSAADMALASHLAFYTGHDCERIERLMQRSELRRDKWARESYLRGTILRVTGDRTQFYGSAFADNEGEPPLDADEIEVIRERIEADAGNLSRLPDLLGLVARIADKVMREAATGQLKRALKDAGVYTSKLGASIDEQLNRARKRTDGRIPGEGEVLPLDVPLAPTEWHHAKGQDLKPRGTIENLEIMLRAYGVTVRFDEILKEASIEHPGQTDGVLKDEAALGRLSSLCALNDYPKGDLEPNLSVITHQHTFNPVRDWITSTPWDGFDRFDQFFDALTLANPAEAPLARILLRKWLRAAVAIGLGLTQKMEYVLVFVDPLGGAGKTRFFSTLAPSAFVKDSLTLDTSDRDSVKIATSCWLAELGELDGTFRRSDQAKLKAFLSSHVDEMRMPYGRKYNKYPRRTAFFASVNTVDFLIDASNNRRFWPINITHANHRHNIDMQQLWAQMFADIQAQQSWYLDTEESAALAGHNEMHRAMSRITEALSECVDVTAPRVKHMSVTAILKCCQMHNANKGELNEAANWLRLKGFEQTKVSGKRGFWMPEIVPPVFQQPDLQAVK